MAFRRSLTPFLVAALVLGALAILLSVAKAGGLVLVLDILVAAATFAAGFLAKSRGAHPAWSGAATGAVYGFVGGLKGFFQRTTAAEIRSALAKTHKTSPLSTAQLVHAANSLGAHIATLIVTVLLFALVGVVLGAVAGAIAGGREAQRSGV